MSTGVLAFALGAAATFGNAAAGTDTTEPTGTTGSSAAPADMAAGCAQIVALLDAQITIAAAYADEDHAAFGAGLDSLPGLAAAAQEAAPAEIADAVTAWAEPLAAFDAMFEGVDLTDIDAVTATLSSLPPNEGFSTAQTEVESWATDNCGWLNEIDDPFADAPEPQECDVLDPAVAAAAAGIEVDVTDSDGGGDINLGSLWQKSCSYGDGAMTISTISFTDIEQVAQFFADNLVDADGNPGEFIDVDLGGLPASTLVANVGGLTSVTVLEATIPFAVGFSGDDIDPAIVVAAAEALFATLPAEAPPPPTTEPMLDGTMVVETTT